MSQYHAPTLHLLWDIFPNDKEINMTKDVEQHTSIEFFLEDCLNFCGNWLYFFVFRIEDNYIVHFHHHNNMSLIQKTYK